jgi:hypothetical protein
LFIEAWEDFPAFALFFGIGGLGDASEAHGLLFLWGFFWFDEDFFGDDDGEFFPG